MIPQFLKSFRLFDLALSPREDRLAFTMNLGGTLQLWTLPAAGGFPRLLTSDDDRRFNWLFADFGSGLLDWSPNGKWIAAAMDFQGDENMQIHLISPEGGAASVLPWQKGEQCQLGLWSPDSRHYFYTSNRRNPKYIDVWRYDLRTQSSEMVLGDTHLYTLCRVAPRNGKILVLKTLSHLRTELYLLDLKTRKMQLLTPWPDREMEVAPVGWDATGKLWVVLRRGDDDFVQLHRYEDLKPSPRVSQMTRDRWDKSAAFLKGKKQLLVTRNVAGRSQVSIMDARSGSERKTPLPTDGVIAYPRAGKGHIFFHYSSPWQSPEIYSWKIGARKITPLTDLWNRALNPRTDVVRPRPHRYSSEAGEVHGLLYLPAKKTDQKPPCIVWIHGGPQAQEVAQYTSRYQLLAKRGYAVWVPNHRGSTGFGRAHCRAIERNWGAPDLADLKNGLEYLRGLGQIDMDRLAVIGKSYGGYMTLWCATQLPETWKAAVDIYGPSSLVTMLEHSPAHWREIEKEWLGDPVADRDRLLRQSPITYIDRVKCPMLVIQGRHDPRVVASESEQVVAKLKSLGKPVDYICFEDEGHDFAKFSNECLAYDRILAFFDRHLQRLD